MMAVNPPVGLNCAVNAGQNNLLQQQQQQQSNILQQQQQHNHQQQNQQPPSCRLQTTNPPPPPYPRQPPQQPTTLAGIVNPTLQQFGLTTQSSQNQPQLPQGQATFSSQSIKMEPHNIDLSPASDANPASSLSSLSSSLSSSDLSDDVGLKYTTLTPPSSASHIQQSAFGMSSPPATLESVFIDILERQQLREQVQQRHREKIEVCYTLDLSLDPWKWTSPDVTKWATWLVRKICPKAAQDVTNRFELSPITGETLVRLSEAGMQHYFAESSPQAHECLLTWLEGMSPRVFEIQNEMLNLERAKQQCIERLVDEMSTPVTPDLEGLMTKSSPALTPPPSAYDIPAEDVLRSINNSMALENIKPEITSAFPFPDPYLGDFAPMYHQSPMACTLPQVSMQHPHNIGMGNEYFDPSNIEPMAQLEIESDSDVSDKFVSIKEDPSLAAQPVKRKRGRPRKPKFPKQKRDQPILYKFILKHLNDMSGESRQYVEWVNKPEGLFRFYSGKKDDFAEMWGRFKGKREHMTYQNMARALRNYTRGNRKIMTSVRKKLHYKFTPTFIQ